MTDIVAIDQIYIGVTDLARSEAFYDRAMRALGYRKTRFAVNREPRIEYFGRDVGYVLRPAASRPTEAAAGPQHLCLAVASPDEVGAIAQRLREAGIAASDPELRTCYAPDYWATFFTDPDGLHLEVTNYRNRTQQRLPV
jgi:catechol 2,3-dioxygenase-like lactoylglutathione lyase family enzyme